MTTRRLGPCLVCGDIAKGINFGIPTCVPCKAFFRRNAVKLGRVEFECQQDGDCPVTYHSRRNCNCCRLAKCFHAGMIRSLIRSDAEKQKRRELVQQNRERRALAPVAKAFDSIISSSVFCFTQRKLKYLSLPDQALLVNVFNSHKENFSALKQGQYPSFPSKQHSSMYEYFNEYSSREKWLVEYLKVIPEFNRISMDDKVRLIKNHFGLMLHINEPILDGNTTQALLVSIKNLFPTESKEQLRAIELMHSYTRDPILLKLVLIVQSLSSGTSRYIHGINLDCVYEDTLAIFHGQNVYVELLWRYILARSTTERDAVKFFNKLIIDLLFVQRTGYAVGCYIHRLRSEIDKMEPLMQSMWPKTNKLNSANDHNVEV